MSDEISHEGGSTRKRLRRTELPIVETPAPTAPLLDSFTPDPQPDVSPSPIVGNNILAGWDISELIAEFSASVQSGQPGLRTTARPTQRHPKSTEQYQDADDDQEEDQLEQGEKEELELAEDDGMEEEEEETKTAAIPNRSTSSTRLQPNKNFLGNILKSTLKHNERVEQTVGITHMKPITASSSDSLDPKTARYKRARGIVLLNHIAQQYGISIVIRPSPTDSLCDEQQAAQILRQQKAQHDVTKLLPRPKLQLSRTISNPETIATTTSSKPRIIIQRTITNSTPSPITPSFATTTAASPTTPSMTTSVSNVRRTFSTGLGPSPSPPPTSTIHLTSSDSGTPTPPSVAPRKVVSLKQRPSPSPEASPTTPMASDATLPASSPPATAPTTNANGKLQLQLTRKRKDVTSINESMPTATLSSPTPSPSPPLSTSDLGPDSKRLKTTVTTNPPVVSTVSGRGPAHASTTSLDRRRSGGLLGAALKGIIGR